MYKLENYPEWVCGDCGNKYGKWSVGSSTWHEGICEVCNKEKPVTSPRDYGYPNFENNKVNV